MNADAPTTRTASDGDGPGGRPARPGEQQQGGPGEERVAERTSPPAARPAPDDDPAPLLARLASLPEGSPDRRALRDELVHRHLPLAEHLAARFLGRGEPHDDLVQVATIGLLKAVDRFDPERGVPFGAYAVPTMLGEIKRHFRDRGWAMRVPRRWQEAGRSLADAREALTHELGRAPTVAELAARTGREADEVVEVLESANAYTTLPLDTGSPTSPVASLGSLDDRLLNVENREALRPLLVSLAPRERRILALRFVRGMSQAQIAAEVGISQMHVSRLLARTLAELREALGEEDG
ncbi:SigB/SigF/SigG family RNA polymerase sigma factor [Kineococcus rubinsiae]|uniref:SigB/SigF/SigG family RNA polymerase sigma factor n=1 Tax=Kineococcus rubinsiae TaxID=2609562 RepID=UPI0027E3C346|nr:SigB/SigF/SigG family RNA polymerase sigma factor [Kineococcus rubinsiae]